MTNIYNEAEGLLLINAEVVGQGFDNLYIIFFQDLLYLSGGGVRRQARNFRNKILEITVNPKVPPSESTFLSGLEDPDRWCHRGGHSHSPAKNSIFPRKNIKIIIYYHQSIDNSLLSYHEKFQPRWTKNGQKMYANLWNNL